MMSSIMNIQPTIEYGKNHNEARFIDGTPSFSYTILTKYNVDANKLRGIPI